MKNRIIALAASFVILLTVTWIVKFPGEEGPETRLHRVKVLQIAEAAAESEGIDLKKYDMTECRYEPALRNHTWLVRYELKQRVIGGYFTVYVNDVTKNTRLSRGY